MITRSNIVFFFVIVLWMPRGASVLRVNPRVTAVPDNGITTSSEDTASPVVVDDSITTSSEDTASPMVVDGSITTSSEDTASPVVVDDSITTSSGDTASPMVVDDSITTSSGDTASPMVVDGSITTSSEDTASPVVVDGSITTSSEDTASPVVVDDSITTSSGETATPVVVDASTAPSSEETATPTNGIASVTGSSEMHTSYASSLETLSDTTIAMSCSPKEEFACNNGYCLDKEWVCDGEDDCEDGEDETDCYVPNCPTFTYQCPDSIECISRGFLCDNEEDCPGGEDESDCHACRSREYNCKKTMSCIRVISVCDGKRDCRQGDDELDCGTINSTRTCTKQANALGFIKGTSVDCYCTEKMSEASAIQVEWEVLDKNHPSGITAFFSMMNSAHHLDVSYGAERSLVCFHDGGHTTMHLKFAYINPNSLTLKMDTEMNLCDEIPISPLLRATRHRRRRNFSQVQCLIEKTDVHPAPLFSFSVNDGEFNTPKEAFDSIYSSFYKGLFHFIPSKGGVHNIKCRVINSAYREIHQEVMKTITVREPPRDPPMLIIKEDVFTGKNEAVLNVTGSEILSPATVACFVNGGFPSATITHRECCAVFDPSQYSSNATMFRCTCRAQHVTGCYSNDESSVTWRNE